MQKAMYREPRATIVENIALVMHRLNGAIIDAIALHGDVYLLWQYHLLGFWALPAAADVL